MHKIMCQLCDLIWHYMYFDCTVILVVGKSPPPLSYCKYVINIIVFYSVPIDLLIICGLSCLFTDINECSLSKGGCAVEEECINTLGSFHCAVHCENGFRRSLHNPQGCDGIHLFPPKTHQRLSPACTHHPLNCVIVNRYQL